MSDDQYFSKRYNFSSTQQPNYIPQNYWFEFNSFTLYDKLMRQKLHQNKFTNVKKLSVHVQQINLNSKKLLNNIFLQNWEKK